MTPYLYEKAYHGIGNDYRIGQLPAWIECRVTEERNGEFFLEGTLPVGGLNVDQLAIDRIIMAAPSPPRPPIEAGVFTAYVEVQPFRIRRLYKDAGGEAVHVVAHHVAYQLSENIVKPTFSRAYADIQDFLDEGFNQSGAGTGFVVPDLNLAWNFVTDIELLNAIQIDHDQPVSVRAWIGGEGGLLELLTGKVDSDNRVLPTPEVDWNGWTIQIKKDRGSVKDIAVAYRYNMERLAYDTDATGLITGYYGWWRKGTFADAVVYSSNVSDYAYPRVQAVDLSNEFETQPTTAQLEAILDTYTDLANKIPTSITVNAVPDKLQGVFLCDSITVIHPVYQIKRSAKIVRTVYDPIHERYESITIGEIQAGITDTISRILEVIT